MKTVNTNIQPVFLENWQYLVYQAETPAEAERKLAADRPHYQPPFVYWHAASLTLYVPADIVRVM